MIRGSQFKYRFGSGMTDTGTPLEARAGKLLTFIHAYIAEHGGVSPSFVEMAAAIGVRSKGHVFKLLNVLEDEGMIRRMHDRARALEVVHQISMRPPLVQPSGNAKFFVFNDETKELEPLRRRT